MADGRSIAVTVSAGCVCYPLLPGQPWQDSLKVADLAMYMAKQAGRNRALCLMHIAAGTSAQTLLADLGAASQAGQVTLELIAGPCSDAVAMSI